MRQFAAWKDLPGGEDYSLYFTSRLDTDNDVKKDKVSLE